METIIVTCSLVLVVLTIVFVSLSLLFYDSEPILPLTTHSFVLLVLMILCLTYSQAPHMASGVPLAMVCPSLPYRSLPYHAVRGYTWLQVYPMVCPSSIFSLTLSKLSYPGSR